MLKLRRHLGQTAIGPAYAWGTTLPPVSPNANPALITFPVDASATPYPGPGPNPRGPASFAVTDQSGKTILSGMITEDQLQTFQKFLPDAPPNIYTLTIIGDERVILAISADGLARLSSITGIRPTTQWYKNPIVLVGGGVALIGLLAVLRK